MNILVVTKEKTSYKIISVIDEIEQPEEEVRTAQEIIEYLQQYDSQFKLLAYDGSAIKRELYLLFCKEMLGVEFKKYFYDGYISILEKAQKANLKQTRMYDIFDFLKVDNILECNRLLTQLVPEQNILNMSSMSHIEKVTKFMSPRYVQINDNGDIYISSMASKNEKILSFICEEIVNRFA